MAASYRRNDVGRGFSIMRMSLLLRCTFTPRHLAGTRRDLDHKAKHEMLGFLLDMHRGKDSSYVGMTLKEDSALCECPCSYDALALLVISQRSLPCSKACDACGFRWTCFGAKIPPAGRNDGRRECGVLRECPRS
jgi:hypothetical protein